MDLKIRTFQNNIINYINNVDLPIEVKRLAVKDIYSQLEAQADKNVRTQIAQKEATAMYEKEKEREVTE